MAQPENHLIALLPRKDRLQLLSLCASVPLLAGERLAHCDAPELHAYFPVAGVISLLVSVDEHPALEVGSVGREGVLGVQIVLGAVQHGAWAAVVSAAGSAWRISAPDLKAAWVDSPPLQRTLGNYTGNLLTQLATNSGCAHYHQIGPRLARWLLMTQDRTRSDHVHITHEFLSRILGVRRVGITAAASALQRDGLVDYHRGELVILNRTGLEAASCSCYQVRGGLYATDKG